MSEFSARPLTAPGTAAIAAVGFYGAGAAAFLAARMTPRGGVVGKSGVLPAVGRQRWLTWREGATAIDDVIVVALPAGSGGEYEVHGHGGAAGMRQWQAAVTAAGGRWLTGDGLAGEEKPARQFDTAAGWRADFARIWAEVETETQAAAVAASQALVAGYWRREPDRRRWPKAWQLGLLSGAEERIEGLLTRRRVLLSGPVNAGKSTLLNALLRDRRALTSDRAGTTRDLVTGRIELSGMAVELIDSAGLRAGMAEPDPTLAPVATTDHAVLLEAQGMQRTTEAQAQVDWTLWLSPVDAPVAPPADWLKVTVAVSKSDLAGSTNKRDGEQIAFSALTSERLPELLALLAERLLPTARRSAAMTPGVCSAQQRAAVTGWIESADAG